MESHINIVDLPFDVLQIIFSELKLKDTINFGLAHPNLGEVFLILYKKQFLHINLDDLPNIIWCPLLSLCGHIVESLSWASKSTSLALNYASKYCKSLQEIKFSIVSSDAQDEMRHRLCEFKNLNTFSMSNSDYVNLKNIDGIFQTLQELPNLRKLSLSEFNPWSLTALRKLTQLQSLKIHMPDKCNELDIGYICSTLNNLRDLTYRGVIKEEDSFQALPQFCPLLESFHIDTSSSIRVPYFPKLKCLSVFSSSLRPVDATLGGFGFLYAKQLDKLRIVMPNAWRCKNEELLEELNKIPTTIFTSNLILQPNNLL